MRSLGLQTPQAASMELLKAHRSAITLYLNTALAKVSKEQKDQQEIRFKRQLDRNSHSLKLDAYSAKLANEHKATKSTSSESIFTPKPFIPTDGPPIESLLSPAQIQQFESEQSVLLQQTQSELAALKQAESSLLEISTLQSELVLHLTQQSEITDKLWEDSMYVSGRVDEGNKQLKKAKERNRDSRIWLLIFLIGASLSLLFLEAF
jgi:syntaxin 18